MVRYIIVAILFELLLGCKSNVGQEQKIVFSGYAIPIAGGHIDLKLDSITPLTELIPQLRSNNKLYETGKGYWIGYNDLMFSIAIHAEDAIEPLLNFIDTTNSFEAIKAAIYTIHLIGINCKIVGRDYEEFTNAKARDALFKLLHKNDRIQREVMLLLIRDPRESDIPRLFNILDTAHNDCWAISNGLLRYQLRNKPIAQDVPVNLANNSIRLRLSDSVSYNKNNHIILKALAKKFGGSFIVEDTLFNYQFDHAIGGCNETHDYFIHNILFFACLVDFGFIGNNFQYVIKDNKIYLCSPMTSKKLWLNWWNSQTKSYKDSLIKSEKRIIIN